MLDIYVRPPVDTRVIALDVECENGWTTFSARDVDDTSSQRFTNRGEPRGECEILVRAFDRDNKVLKLERRKVFASNDLPPN
jgi:hypothetical protein